jgi:hypothetical protein
VPARNSRDRQTRLDTTVDTSLAVRWLKPRIRSDDDAERLEFARQPG